MARKLAAMAAALVALAAVPTGAGAIAIASHSVSADIATNGNYIRVNASSATSPLGTVTINVPGSPLAVVGRVECLRVSGNTAYVVYRDTSLTARRDGTIGGYVRLLDGAGAPDAQNNGRFPAARLNREVANGCPIPTSGPSFHPLHAIDLGTITVS
jgi:hypothetical protein